MTDRQLRGQQGSIPILKLAAYHTDDILQSLGVLHLLAGIIGRDGAPVTSILMNASIEEAAHEMGEIKWELSNLIRRLSSTEQH